ncbi:zinc ribbon domain-containing protein [filamentous cyanobacterium LEGE 11480]|uniref:Zinc ribbon domain-containing protein n=1 Tax=Romeriopsis navalis LEGE 11480 TaxID=2777977 RepID=A0A928VHW2_9CYAN|nr:zinc ribbon domain-containing protein [Romeriopsis navalis]MBE9028896.1 zinc ribbon domain-containing protein [Romeriopsis navalis LEGE 11480]
MPYMCDISPNQTVFLDNPGDQTVLTCMSGQVGQQQQSSSSFTTGRWSNPPELWRSSQGLFIQIHGESGITIVQIQNNGLHVTSAQAIGQPAQTIPMQPVAAMPNMPTMQSMQPMPPIQPMPPMQPMSPMQPMPPMNMSNMNSAPPAMQMQMGNMQMSMDNPTNPKSSSSNGVSHSLNSSHSTPTQRNFCSGCGQPIRPNDNFCSSCGQKLE